MSHRSDANCWISFVLYAVTGQMAQADAVMRESGAAVRRHAKRQRKLVPIKENPLFRGLLIDNGRPVSNHAFFEAGEIAGIVMNPGRRDGEPESVIGDDGCVAHAIDTMRFVSHSEDLGCAQWFATPEAAVSGFVAELHPNVRGYVVRLERPSSTVLWHHKWQACRMQGGMSIPLVQAALQHPHIAPFADQFHFNARTQSEVILEPSSERLKIVPVEEVDVKALDRKFCHPVFLAQQEAKNAQGSR